jgi:hypothetical protein
MNEEFIKHDTGKPMMSLIEPSFIRGLADVLTFGANKYEKNNWKLADSTEGQDRIKDAMLRHIYKYLDGQEFDDETGFSHLYHAAFGLMALSYFDTKKTRTNRDIGILNIDELASGIKIVPLPDFKPNQTEGQ